MINRRDFLKTTAGVASLSLVPTLALARSKAPTNVSELYDAINSMGNVIPGLDIGQYKVLNGHRYEHITYAVQTKSSVHHEEKKLVKFFWDDFSSKLIRSDNLSILWRRLPLFSQHRKHNGDSSMVSLRLAIVNTNNEPVFRSPLYTWKYEGVQGFNIL